ncbi:MAG TPA: LysE family transporter, partial [Bauldia sp.]|nr:LysE family transporter [Bauldia sp.]
WEEFCEYWDRTCREDLEINRATRDIFSIRIPKPRFVLMPTPLWDQMFKPMVGAQRWIAAGLFGLKALFVALPFAGVAIKFAGAAYLVWFGVQMVLSAGGAGGGAARRGGAAFRAGLATTLANPKSAAVAASLLAVALPEGAPGLLAGEAFAVLLAISASWYLAVAVLGSMPPVVRAFLAGRRMLTRIAGAVFVLFGLKLALER